MLKNVLIYSVTIVYTISIGVLSLAHLTKVPELNTGFDDKIAHFVLYAGLCLFWFMSFHILKSKECDLVPVARNSSDLDLTDH